MRPFGKSQTKVAFHGRVLSHKESEPDKAEPIRLTQKEMLDGKIKSSGTSNGCRAETLSLGAKKDEFKCAPNAPFYQPYFWSLFVIIGNWR